MKKIYKYIFAIPYIELLILSLSLFGVLNFNYYGITGMIAFLASFDDSFGFKILLIAIYIPYPLFSIVRYIKTKTWNRRNMLLEFLFIFLTLILPLILASASYIRWQKTQQSNLASGEVFKSNFQREFESKVNIDVVTEDTPNSQTDTALITFKPKENHPPLNWFSYMDSYKIFVYVGDLENSKAYTCINIIEKEPFITLNNDCFENSGFGVLGFIQNKNGVSVKTLFSRHENSHLSKVKISIEVLDSLGKDIRFDPHDKEIFGQEFDFMLLP